MKKKKKDLVWGQSSAVGWTTHWGQSSAVALVGPCISRDSDSAAFFFSKHALNARPCAPCFVSAGNSTSNVVFGLVRPSFLIH